MAGIYSGARWQRDDGLYASIFAGILKPKSLHREVGVDASIVSLTDEFSTQETGQALRSLEAAKEREMQDKALAEIAKIDEKTLPFLGFDVGFEW